MIKKIIDRLLGKPAAAPKASFGKRRVISEQEHRIDHELVDERALNVVRTLQERGYEAYIVGGAVRDFAAPSSLAGVFASCMWCMAGAATTR
jgi:poly(A) polymerase